MLLGSPPDMVHSFPSHRVNAPRDPDIFISLQFSFVIIIYICFKINRLAEIFISLFVTDTFKNKI